jgi:hypothetical protein
MNKAIVFNQYQYDVDLDLGIILTVCRFWLNGAAIVLYRLSSICVPYGGKAQIREFHPFVL